MSDSSPERPDILVFMTDQHSKHLLGCYGNELVRTPAMDRLASQGMRFTNAYCPGPLCVPSRMSFMTSRTPSNNRVWENLHILSSNTPTWAHALGTAGYETALLGRMHFEGPDQRHGFELRPIGEYYSIHPGAPYLGGPSTDFHNGTHGQERSAVEIAGRGTTRSEYFSRRVTQVACKFFRERAKQKERRPFAAVIGHGLPHCPFVAPQELFDYYYSRVDIPPIEESQPETIRRFRDTRGILEPPLDEERIRVARAAYFGMCELIDSLFGQVMECLDETGLSRNTLVVYTTDHGDMAGEHGCWWKSNYYEGSVGVPMIARWPSVVPEGSVSDAICNLTDLGPTFAEMAGAEPMAGVDGRSLVEVLQGGRPADWVDETYSEFVELKHGNVFPSRMIRSGPWKLWVYGDEANLPPALFNLDEDPDELNDLVTSEEHADIRNELLAKVMRDWDPSRAQAESRELQRDYMTLRKWGRVIKPVLPEAVPMPPPEVEGDVELL